MRVQKVMVQPISLIFRFLQTRTRVVIWLYEQLDTRLEGRIIGFDEFMNIVLDDTVEIGVRKRAGAKKVLGRIMLKGDNITLIQAAATPQIGGSRG